LKKTGYIIGVWVGSFKPLMMAIAAITAAEIIRKPGSLANTRWI